MTVRLATLASALVLGALPLRAQQVEYAAGTTRYRVSTTTKGSQVTPIGSSDFELGLRQQITLNLARQAKDTILATITLDSIALSGAASTADVSSLMGATFTSLVSPTGRVYSTRTPSGASPLASQIAEAVTRFLPSYRGNLRAGVAWSDTSSGKMSQQGMDVDRTIVSNFTVEGDTTIGGLHAFKVARVSSVKAAGSGTSQGVPVSMESTSTSNGRFFLSDGGVFLGATSSDDMNLKLKILAQGAEISMRQSAQTRIEPIQ